MASDDACDRRAPATALASAPRVWQAAEAVHIDVRGLAPPQPLIEILRLVATLPPDGVLIVHHDRDPMLLYPELAEIGWCAERIAAADPAEVRLRVVRASTTGAA